MCRNHRMGVKDLMSNKCNCAATSNLDNAVAFEHSKAQRKAGMLGTAGTG